MAITTQDGLVAALAGGQDVTIQKASATTTAGNWHSLWDRAGTPGAGSLTIGNTTNGIVPTDATAGSPVISAFTGANTGYLGDFDGVSSSTGVIRLYDRLFHVGSINANTLTTTTFTAQPALARLPSGNASGLGLELWLEINVAISATATTVSATYTNSAGVTGRTATLDSNISGYASGRMAPFRLQAGDVGIQRLDSVIVGGTAATAGSFNLVVLRTLTDHNVTSNNLSEPRQDAFRVGLPILFTDSCLALMFLPTTTSSGNVFTDFTVING